MQKIPNLGAVHYLAGEMQGGVRIHRKGCRIERLHRRNEHWRQNYVRSIVWQRVVY